MSNAPRRCAHCGNRIRVPGEHRFHPECEPEFRRAVPPRRVDREPCARCGSRPLGLTPGGLCGWCYSRTTARHRSAA